MQKLFENQTIGRVLVADYTTKAEFVIPGISEILDPKKYEVIDRDIREGLGNVLLGEEKFANTKIKIQVFAQKLKEARSAFLKDFLEPEIKRISKAIGFKSYPKPEMSDIDLYDNLDSGRVYTRLAELGVLTPIQALEAIETNKLPDEYESVKSQKQFLAYKNEGLYQPLVGGKNVGAEAGRPSGTKNIPQIKTTRAKEELFSVKGVIENFKDYNSFYSKVVDYLKKKHKKKNLSQDQINFAYDLAQNIVINEPKKCWDEKNIENFLKNPQIKAANERTSRIDEIAATHNCDHFTAALLYESRVSDAEK